MSGLYTTWHETLVTSDAVLLIRSMFQPRISGDARPPQSSVWKMSWPTSRRIRIKDLLLLLLGPPIYMA